MGTKRRIAVGLLTISAAAFATWQASEGFTSTAVIPTKDDVPTIGHGSTRYEDGSRVQMGDTITRDRAAELARNLMDADARKLAATMPGAKLTQGEFDVYADFVGQYGLGNWRGSSMRRHVMQGEYVKACGALLRYKYAAGYDCSQWINGKPNRRCYGVWTRQLKRHEACMAAQP